MADPEYLSSGKFSSTVKHSHDVYSTTPDLVLTPDRFIRPRLSIDEVSTPDGYVPDGTFWAAGWFACALLPKQVCGKYNKVLIMHKQEEWEFVGVHIMLAPLPSKDPTEQRYTFTHSGIKKIK